MKPVVLYTDPQWILGPDGSVEPGRAGVEREAFGTGFALDFGDFERGKFVLSGARFLEKLRAADAVVISRAQVTAELAAAMAGRCKVVARQGVGIDNVAPALLAEHGILAFNVPDYCVGEVSDHTLALLLALERKVCAHDRRVRAGRWSPLGAGRPRRLAERSVGIVGLGRIGRATARKLGVFYGAVAAYDPYVAGDLMAGYGVRRVESLRGLLAAVDAVVLHAALDASTRRMIDAEALAAMRPGALLVNTARGELVDSRAVADALASGRLGGFASDVFSPEDPNDDPTNRGLLAHEDVVVTSHCAYLSAESELSLRRRVAEEVRRVLETGEPPRVGRLA